LFNQLTRPRLRGLLDDCYRDISYELDEDAFALAEEDDLVRKRFIRSWEALVEGYKVSRVVQRVSVLTCRTRLLITTSNPSSR
jgi:hypothetical protein